MCIHAGMLRLSAVEGGHWQPDDSHDYYIQDDHHEDADPNVDLQDAWVVGLPGRGDHYNLRSHAHHEQDYNYVDLLVQDTWVVWVQGQDQHPDHDQHGSTHGYRNLVDNVHLPRLVWMQ